MDLLLGIDMGTTHIKVATFDIHGNLHTLEMARTKTTSLGVGKAIYQSQEIWNTVVTLLNKTTVQLGAEDKILSISVASMGESGLFVDKAGEALTPIIAWFDVRGKEMMDEWYGRISSAQCFSITGLSANYIYSLFKMLWIKTHQPEVMEQAAKWLCMPDFIYYCLTGEFATDYSIASRTMLFDIQDCKWSETLLSMAELDKELLPPPYPGGTVIGEVGHGVAQLTGLPNNTPVVVGGHDHICGSFAANVIEPGYVLDSCGTADSLIAVFRDLPQLNMEFFRGFNVGRHVVPGLYYMQGGVDSAGISIEWFLEQFCKDSSCVKMTYQEMMAQARLAQPGSQGLFFIPHLRGASPPAGAPDSRACFLGIRDYHTKADFIRSIYEGISCELSGFLESMEAVLDMRFQALHAIGGGTKNELWMEIKSTVIDRPIEVPKVQEATLLGAALLGGVGAGVYRDYQQASQATYGFSHAYYPDSSLREEYKKVYQTYHKVLPLARKISGVISKAQI